MLNINWCDWKYYGTEKFRIRKIEKENINKDKQRNLTSSIRKAKTVKERAELIKDFADKNQMTNLLAK